MGDIHNLATMNRRDMAESYLNDGIEAVAVAGQTQVAASEMIPVDGAEDNCPEEVILGAVDPSNQMFRAAAFPEGWSKRPTDHHMYTDVVDNKGAVRGSIGYKHSAYDPWAQMSWNRPDKD